MVGHVFSFVLCTSDAAEFAHVVSPGVGYSQILSLPGGWAVAYLRTTLGHLAHVFSKDGWVYQEGRGLCQSQNFPPKESNRCIKLRGKYYIVFNFLRERKQGVFAQQKAENCSFVHKRRNFVTTRSPRRNRPLQNRFSYEKKTKTWACRQVRVVTKYVFSLHQDSPFKSFGVFQVDFFYPGFVLTSFLWINKLD